MWKVHFCFFFLRHRFCSVLFFKFNFVGCKKSAFKQNLQAKAQLLSKTAPNIACRRTVCHVPFRGFFPLEKHYPFRWLVLVATRPLTQTVGQRQKCIFTGLAKVVHAPFFFLQKDFWACSLFQQTQPLSVFCAGSSFQFFFFASCLALQLGCAQSRFFGQIFPLFVFVLAFSQPLVSLVKLLFQQVCFTKSLFSASSWLRWPAFFEIGLRHAQGCFQGLLFRISGYTFKQATWALFRQVASLGMQSCPTMCAADLAYAFFLQVVSTFTFVRWRSCFSVRQSANTSRWLVPYIINL